MIPAKTPYNMWFLMHCFKPNGSVPRISPSPTTLLPCLNGFAFVFVSSYT
jgi:hypothetical protein